MVFSFAKNKSKKNLWNTGKTIQELLETASKKRGITGEVLLQMLERRMDNVVFRLGLATSRQEARQLVTHGHFKVNGRNLIFHHVY